MHDPVECLLIKLNGKCFEPLKWNKFFLYIRSKLITFIQSPVDTYIDFGSYNLSGPTIEIPTEHLQIFRTDFQPIKTVLTSPLSPAMQQARYSKIVEESASKAANKMPQFLIKSKSQGGFVVLVVFKDENMARGIYNLRDSLEKKGKAGPKTSTPKKTSLKLPRIRTSESKIGICKSRHDTTSTTPKSERSRSLLGSSSLLEKIRSRSRSKTPSGSKRRRSRSFFGRKSSQPPIRSGEVFQVGLKDQIISPDFKHVPLFLHLTITALESHGLHYEGLYRKCGSERMINELVLIADSGKINPERVLKLECWDHPHVIAAAIKRFFRYLPESLLYPEDWKPVVDIIPSEDIPLSEKSYQEVLEAVRIKLQEMKSRAREQIQKTKEASRPLGLKYIQPTFQRLRRSLSGESISDIEKTPSYNSRRYSTLIFLLNHLRRLIDNQETNKCSAYCVATSIGPSLIDFEIDDTKKFNRVFEIILGNWKILSAEHSDQLVLEEEYSLMTSKLSLGDSACSVDQRLADMRSKLRGIFIGAQEIYG
nr:rho GTPase activating protein 23 [Hymenolepis microstoma]